MKRLENVTEAWIISGIKPRVREGDKSRGAQPCARLLTHNGTASHTNPDRDVSPGGAVLPRPDLPVTMSLNTTAAPCRYAQTHIDVTPKHAKDLLTLPNTLAKTRARLKRSDTGKPG